MEAIVTRPSFSAADLGRLLAPLAAADLDALGFGVIGFDATGIVRVYNRHEATAAGLNADRVLGRHLFREVAPCMNNDLVAGRFVDARSSAIRLDATIKYVLSLRMRPTPVQLRLIGDAQADLAYVLVSRVGSGDSSSGTPGAWMGQAT